jgi:hypothetical protein
MLKIKRQPSKALHHSQYPEFKSKIRSGHGVVPRQTMLPLLVLEHFVSPSAQ